MKKTVLIAFVIIPVLLIGTIFICGSGSFSLSNGGSLKSDKPKSEWVYPDKDGKLVYKTTSKGDRIMDFSHAGYMGGGVVLPVVPVKRTVQPSGGADDTGLIQSAIDEVAALPLQNGFRGAVELGPGTFTCAGTIKIPVSGIVLRGSGSGEGGTTIRMVGDRHRAIEIGVDRTDGRASEEVEGTQPVFVETHITDPYVPSGTAIFTVADASGFQKGDKIEIKKPMTEAWIELMQMHNLVRDGKPQTWISENSSLEMERKILSISGNTVTIDVPLSDSFDATYLSPPGASIRKINPSQKVEQVGVEFLHIQCPPLETYYGRAPFSGLRLRGNDCWVKDVFFEETMNTTVLEGDRNTFQEVVIKHTYPNLGASKPTDFSIEGTQNLLDRCKSTGGNTYFVWTSSLVPGPNVVLNSVFRGHGSRIQPHQRWATGLLIDNCVIPDGGIDFMNRGVAGSGHGWTMGWGVAWNCIASTYIIQNPPGVVNWAIGSIGERVQIARLFDSEPILYDGTFDSHGIPVTPQSLYLAQLRERIGEQALKNIGYSSNSIDEFTGRSVPPLPPQKIVIDSLLGQNLALHRPINTSNVKGETRDFGGENAIDGDDGSYWSVDDGVTEASFTVDTEGPVKINKVAIGEASGMRGRVQKYKIEGQLNSDWKVLSQGSTIGARKVDTFPEVTVWKVRFSILEATAPPAINTFGLYLKEK